MSADASAYDILGLEPGADPVAVDAAYRRLIKRYHPDRAGGDARRAAEINRAYFELRRTDQPAAERAPGQNLDEAIYAERLARRRYVAPPRRKRRIWPLLAVAVAGLAHWKHEPLLALMREARADVVDMLPSPGVSEDQAIASTGEPQFDSPLERPTMDLAIQRAAALAIGKDQEALLAESRACHRDLRESPSLVRLDRCAAFDNAVLEIENRSAIQEEGPFAASAVTSRQMAAAKLLSRNYEAIEERLDRVRTHVQLVLAPPDPMLTSATSTGSPAVTTPIGRPNEPLPPTKHISQD